MAGADDPAFDPEAAAQAEFNPLASTTSRAEIVSPLDSVSFCRSALVEIATTLA